MPMARGDVFVFPATPIVEVVACIDRGRVGAAVVIDENRRLVGVVTDGDVRRALLARLDLTQPVQTLLDRRPRDLYPEPVAAPASMAAADRLVLMRARRVRHLPILAADGTVTGFDCLDDLSTARLDVTGLVMAGGFGRRMAPLTDGVPKPLLPVGAKPLLEHLVSHLAEAGLHDLTIATHYRGEQIRGHFGDGAQFGVAIDYVEEEEPLGTAGALRLLKPQLSRPLMVVNGDLLTRLDVGAMLRFHQEHNADLTVAVRSFETQLPYGIVEVRDERVSAVLEKPTSQHFINAGVYLIEPRALDWLPAGAHVDMPEFINSLIAAGRAVVGFPVREYWLDVGHLDNYARAQDDLLTGRY